MTKSTVYLTANEEGQSQITLISSLITIGVLVISAIVVIIILIGKFSYTKNNKHQVLFSLRKMEKKEIKVRHACR